MVYLPLSRLVPLFIQQRYDTNPAVRSTCSQKIYLLCLSGVEGLLSGAQKPLNDHVTNLQLKTVHPCRGATRSRRARYIIGRVGQCDRHLSAHPYKTLPACRSRRGRAPEGSSAFSPGVEARSADDPGSPPIRLIDTTPIGCRTPRASLIVRPLAGSRGFFPADLSRGLRRGLRPSSTPGLFMLTTKLFG